METYNKAQLTGQTQEIQAHQDLSRWAGSFRNEQRTSSEKRKKMKMRENINDQDKNKIMKYIGSVYCRCCRRMEAAEFGGNAEQGHLTYSDDLELIHLIDSTLLACEKNTRCIIRHDFLSTNNEKDWYQDFYSRSSYYRLRRAAIDEFIRCLNI